MLVGGERAPRTASLGKTLEGQSARPSIPSGAEDGAGGCRGRCASAPAGHHPKGPAREAAGAEGWAGAEQLPLHLPDWVTARELRSAKAARRCAAARTRPQDLRVLDSWSEFLRERIPGPVAFCTFTYDDKRGEKRNAYTSRAAFGDHMRFVRRELKFEGRWFAACEPHRWRDIVHLHALYGPVVDEQARRVIRGFWGATRGFAAVLVAEAGSFPYVCKYTFKNRDPRGDALDLRGLVGGVAPRP